MIQLPINVWLSAIVLAVYSTYSIFQNPMLWLRCLGIVIFIVSFVRVLFYLFEGE
jgi:hypothetical protein